MIRFTKIVAKKSNRLKLIFTFTIALFYISFSLNSYLMFLKKCNNIFNNHSITNISLFKTYLINKENKSNIIINGKKFIDKCLNSHYLTTIHKIESNPTISSIIPVYNSEKTIYNSICSIQNQNFADFEIILIDDFSIDNSSKIIKILQEKDKRIKLIKNKKNMGSLYSRSIGVLISKGEFILPLDNDDMFFNYDIFYYFQKLAKDFEFDIIGFRAFQIGNYSDKIENIVDLYNYNYFPEYSIEYQPKLSTWLVNRKGIFYIHDVTIWAKCIKSEIYKKATLSLGIKRYSFFVSWAEDTIINVIIFNYARSFLFINKYGIIHLNNNSTATFTIPDDIKLFGEIFLVDILYDFSKNNSDKNYAVMLACNVKNKFGINTFIRNNTNLIYFKSILIKFLNSQYISIEYKNQIKFYFKSFLV